MIIMLNSSSGILIISVWLLSLAVFCPFFSFETYSSVSLVCINMCLPLCVRKVSCVSCPWQQWLYEEEALMCGAARCTQHFRGISHVLLAPCCCVLAAMFDILPGLAGNFNKVHTGLLVKWDLALGAPWDWGALCGAASVEHEWGAQFDPAAPGTSTRLAAAAGPNRTNRMRQEMQSHRISSGPGGRLAQSWWQRWLGRVDPLKLGRGVRLAVSRLGSECECHAGSHRCSYGGGDGHRLRRLYLPAPLFLEDSQWSLPFWEQLWNE